MQLQEDVLEPERLDVEGAVEAFRERIGFRRLPSGDGRNRGVAVDACRQRVGNRKVARQRRAGADVQAHYRLLESVQVAVPVQAAVLDDPDLVRGPLEI